MPIGVLSSYRGKTFCKKELSTKSRVMGDCQVRFREKGGWNSLHLLDSLFCWAKINSTRWKYQFHLMEQMFSPGGTDWNRQMSPLETWIKLLARTHSCISYAKLCFSVQISKFLVIKCRLSEKKCKKFCVIKKNM